MTPEGIISGLRVTGIYPFDKNVFTPDEFMASYATDRLFQEAQHNDASFLAAFSSSQTSLEFLEETLLPSSTSVTPFNSIVYPKSIRSFGRLEARNKDSKKRKQRKSEIYTDTPVKERIEEEANSKRKGKNTS